MKRRFEFRLARLLRIRTIREQVARAAWAEGQAAENRALETCATRSAELAAARRELARALEEGERPAAGVLLDQRALDRQVDALVGANERLLTARAQARAQKDAWAQRDRDHRALTELEERARGRHRRELEARENAELDEVALLRSERSRRQERRARGRHAGRGCSQGGSSPGGASAEGDDVGLS